MMLLLGTEQRQAGLHKSSQTTGDRYTQLMGRGTRQQVNQIQPLRLGGRVLGQAGSTLIIDGRKGFDKDAVPGMQEFSGPKGLVQARQMPQPFTVRTVEGPVEAERDDWLIQEQSGACWAVPAQEFAGNYQPSDSQEA
jgi:hypothetical protein